MLDASTAAWLDTSSAGTRHATCTRHGQNKRAAKTHNGHNLDHVAQSSLARLSISYGAITCSSLSVHTIHTVMCIHVSVSRTSGLTRIGHWGHRGRAPAGGSWLGQLILHRPQICRQSSRSDCNHEKCIWLAGCDDAHWNSIRLGTLPFLTCLPVCIAVPENALVWNHIQATAIAPFTRFELVR